MQPRHTQFAQLAIVSLLIVGCIAVLLPFVGTLLFAIVIVVTAWPLYARLLAAMRSRHTLAALTMSLALIVLLGVPMSLLSGSLASGLDMLARTVRPLLENGLPADPPELLGRLPLIGSAITEYWHRLVDSREELNSLLRQVFDPARKVALTAVTIFAQGLLQLLLVTFFVFFIFRDAHIYAGALLTAARKLGGPLGERMLKLARGTITGVMVGISTDTKHILNVAALTGVATGVPGVLMLVDMQGYWPGISNNSAVAQTLTGTPTLRYTNGAGCRLFAVQTSVAGATAQNIALSYTDQSGNTGNTLPVTVACTASAIAGHITHSGTAANNYGPFLPLANGDTGVQNVATVTMSAANTGTFALCLVKPLLTLPLTTVSVAAERDLMNQLPSLPQVKDGACLTWLYFAGAATAANTNFYGSTDFGWG